MLLDANLDALHVDGGTEPSALARGPGDPHAALRASIDSHLNQLLPRADHPDSRVAAAMRYGVLAPGKRIRPLLMLLTAQDLGQDHHRLMPAACALEMIHAASLFIDDMPCMDDAQLRRGQPTVHIKYGQDVAVLASIGLLSLALRTVASSPLLPSAVRAEMTAVLAQATELLVAGQYRDLHEQESPSAQAVGAINLQKTGSLFSAAFDMAALGASASGETRRHLHHAALELGQAFQLCDDLDDAEKDAASIGKDCGQDANKTTLVTLLGLQGARQKLAEHLDALDAHLSQALCQDSQVASLLRRSLTPHLTRRLH
ncbi:MAG: polyprenyl synthetase family protein [Burkholderiales bacterium]|nr:MAG: polyprenyl synthetase family protein [Burkholderiales bacterium]